MKEPRSAFLARMVSLVAAVVTTALLTHGVSSATTARSTSNSHHASAHAATTCGVVANAQARITSQPRPCTVTIEVGARMGVSLDRGFQWGNPQSSSRATTLSAVTHPSGGGLRATLRATALGRATVTSTGTIICPPGQTCPMLALLWSLRVIVVRHLYAPQTISVTQDDSGRHFTLHRGDRLAVRLAGPTFYTWTALNASDPSVLRRVASSTGSTAGASFVAAGPGTAKVSAVDNPNCYPQCLPPSRLFQVSVTVIG
jgi:hypothetical protein